jgi:acetate kinase
MVDPASSETLANGRIEQIGAGHPDHDAAIAEVLDDLAAHGLATQEDPPVAIGHRVVHGGPVFHEPVVIDDRVVDDLRALVPLAPLHIPASLAGIRATRTTFPDVPHVAVFDTAFHASLPPKAHTYAVPRVWRERHGVRRYGFHGTSFAYVAGRAASLLGIDTSEANLILLHLGNGASACAVRAGTSVDTSMGLTPLEGLVMGTRSGDVDPSLGAYLARVAGIGPVRYDEELNQGSGLLGLSGTDDFREVVSRRAAGDADADLAFDVAVYRLRKYIGAYAVVLGRVDALVFTGGIGENSPQLRAEVLSGLGILGVELDAAANASTLRGERLLTLPHSRIAAYAIPTDEELEIARACVALVGAAGADQGDDAPG